MSPSATKRLGLSAVKPASARPSCRVLSPRKSRSMVASTRSSGAVGWPSIIVWSFAPWTNPPQIHIQQSPSKNTSGIGWVASLHLEAGFCRTWLKIARFSSLILAMSTSKQPFRKVLHASKRYARVSIPRSITSKKCSTRRSWLVFFRNYKHIWLITKIWSSISRNQHPNSLAAQFWTLCSLQPLRSGHQ